MGGSIAVTIRRPDGGVVKMCRHTNSMPYWFQNCDLFDLKPNYINEYTEYWEMMRDDWLKNNKTGNFKMEQSEWYGDFNLLAPDGYGLVVIDMVNKVIQHMQGYTSFELVNRFCLSAALNRGVKTDPKSLKRMHANVTEAEYGPCDLIRFGRLWTEGRFASVLWSNRNDEEKRELEKFKSLREMCRWFSGRDQTDLKTDFFGLTIQERSKLLNKAPLSPSAIVLDTSPFKIQRFDEGEEGSRKFKETLDDDWWDFTDEEEQKWEDWYRRWDDDDES